jgi:uncharacterized repeat protein (TIGR01451 family)
MQNQDKVRMKILKRGHRKIAVMLTLALLVSFLGVAVTGGAALASPKSLYVFADHSSQFEAWNINADGTVTYQATYNLQHLWAGTDVGMDEDSVTLFMTSEGQNIIEMVDATTMTSLGFTTASGASDLAGLEVDEANNILYTVDRGTTNLYAYDWNDVAQTLTLRAGFPMALANMNGALGLALDEYTGILYVTDGLGGLIRGYDVSTWAEVYTYTPSQPPTDIAVDRLRGFLYTTSPDWYCGWGYIVGQNLLLQIDLATGAERSVNVGHGTMGVAVDEVSGYIYVTGGCYVDTLEVWDPSTQPWTQVQNAGTIGYSPAGIYVPQTEVVFNPLNLSKDDGLGGQCVNAGDTINYQICYDNLDNNFDVTSAVLVDDLPPEVTFVSATGGGTYNGTTHTVTWDIGTIPAGDPGGCETVTVTVNAGVTPGSIITNSVTIDADPPIPPATVNMQTDVCSGVPPPQVPGMTEWGIIATAIVLAGLIPLALRRRAFPA